MGGQLGLFGHMGPSTVVPRHCSTRHCSAASTLGFVRDKIRSLRGQVTLYKERCINLINQGRRINPKSPNSPSRRSSRAYPVLCRVQAAGAVGLDPTL